MNMHIYCTHMHIHIHIYKHIYKLNTGQKEFYDEVIYISYNKKEFS